MRSFPFSNITSSKSRMYFALGTYLNLDEPHCERQATPCPVATAVGRLPLSSGWCVPPPHSALVMLFTVAEVMQKRCFLCLLSGGITMLVKTMSAL